MKEAPFRGFFFVWNSAEWGEAARYSFRTVRAKLVDRVYFGHASIIELLNHGY